MKAKIISIVLLCVILGGMTVTVLAGPAKGSAYSLTVLCAGSGRVAVTVDGELMHSGGGNCMISVPAGAVVTVAAEKTRGDFLYFTDENANTLCEEQTMTFVMVCSKYVQTWFEEYSGTKIVYRNTNTTKQVLASATYVSAEDFTEHLCESATKYGSAFVGWSMSIDDIKAKIAAGESLVEVYPTYKTSEERKSISVDGGQIKGFGSSADVKLMDRITLVADAPAEGESFVGWCNSSGKIVSYNSEFEFSVFESDSYTALFSSNGVAVECWTDIRVEREGDGFRMWSKRFAPKDYELVTYGFIYSLASGGVEAIMTLDAADSNGMSIAEYVIGGANGVLTCYCPSEKLSARAFAVYSFNGSFIVVYSDVFNSN